MSKRLDEVFSVERLRRSWRGVEEGPSRAEQEKADGAPGDAASAAEASYRNLVATIERSFPPDRASAMAPLLEELERLLKLRFPVDAPETVTMAERSKLTMALDGLLNRIEDLLEAFETGAAR